MGVECPAFVKCASLAVTGRDRARVRDTGHSSKANSKVLTLTSVFRRAVVGLLVGAVAIGCDDSADRLKGDGSRGEANAGAAGAAGTGAEAGCTHAGAGGGAEVHDENCHLDPGVYEDDSPSTSSTVPCGRLGDLSAATGLALDVGHEAWPVSLKKTATRPPQLRFAWRVGAVGRGSQKHGQTGQERTLAAARGHDGMDRAPLPWQPALSKTHLAALASADNLAFDLEIRSAIDGDVVATVTMPDRDVSIFGFASDGSYLWAANRKGIRAWTMGGKLLMERSGYFASGCVSSAR